MLTHLDIRFDTNSSLPFIVAAGITLFFFDQDPITQFRQIADFVVYGASVEMVFDDTIDILPPYDGLYKVDLVENQKEYYLPILEPNLFSTLSRFIP